MQIEVAKKRFTVDEYYRMADAGILTTDDRVELIDGEIIEKSPVGSRHVGCVIRANQVLTTAFTGKALLSVQSPIRLSNYTEPEPDLAVLKPRPDYYSTKKPSSEDAFLVIEVADTTLRYDRNVKLPRYAAAGVPEVWIENLEDDLLLVYRDPAGNSYTASLTLGRGDPVSLAAFPDIVFKVDDFVG